MPIKLTLKDKEKITITLKDKEEQKPPLPSASEKNLPITMKLDIRRAVDGSLMIFDHPDMDIVVVPSTSKVVTLPPTNAKFPVADLVVLSIGKFIEKEKPDYLFAQAYEKEVEEMYIDPTEEDSTPLGKVPQAVKKGSIQPYDTRRYLSGYA